MPDRQAETTELVAYHYDQALQYGEADDDLRQRAFAALLAAGDAVSRRGAYASAARLLDRAQQLVPTEEDHARALLLAARIDVHNGNYPGAVDRLDDVIAAAAQGANAALRADALGWKARAMWLRGDWRDALHSAQEATVALEGQADSPELARALARLSQIEMLRGLPSAESNRVSGDRGGPQDGGEDGGGERADEPVHRAVGCRRCAGDGGDAGHRRAGARVGCARRGCAVGRQLPLGGGAERASRACRGDRQRRARPARAGPRGRELRPLSRAVSRRAGLRAHGPVGRGRRRRRGRGAGRDGHQPARVALARVRARHSPRRPRAHRPLPAGASGCRRRERRAPAHPPDGVCCHAQGSSRRRSRLAAVDRGDGARTAVAGEHARTEHDGDLSLARGGRGDRPAASADSATRRAGGGR